MVPLLDHFLLKCSKDRLMGKLSADKLHRTILYYYNNVRTGSSRKSGPRVRTDIERLGEWNARNRKKGSSDEVAEKHKA